MSSLTIDTWNELLLRWFFRPLGRRPVYFRADSAELRRMNDLMGFGIIDPRADLLHAGSLYFSYPGTKLQAWKSGKHAVPPFLTHLAISVLVVEEQLEHGSTAFYDPLSKAFGLPKRLSTAEYQATFHTWWYLLADWLGNKQRGEMGLATWKRIPKRGPRSIIGHPYTQVLLKREDREALDEFLEGFELGELVIADDSAAAAALLEEFALWATTNRHLSQRLTRVLHSSEGEDRESLGYMLLDRITLDQDLQAPAPVASSSTVRLALTLDEWEGRMYISAIGPSTCSPAKPISLSSAEIGSVLLDEPGQPVHTEIDPGSVDPSAGLSLDTHDGSELVMRPANVHFLSRRGWDEWVGVREPEQGETVYALARTDRRLDVESQYGTMVPRTITGLPVGWSLFGPADYTSTSASRVPVPRLVGGLPLRSARVYLLGGEPILESSTSTTSVLLDGIPWSMEDNRLDLRAADLNAGEHTIRCGPYELRISIVELDHLPPTTSEVGLDRAGIVRPAESDHALVSGYGTIPRCNRIIDRVLCPIEDEILVFGRPGVCFRLTPGISNWAAEAGLRPLLFDPAVYSSYGVMGRRLGAPWWVAGGNSATTWLARMDRYEGDDDVQCDWSEWNRSVSQIGPTPTIIDAGSRQDLVLQEWQEYTSSGGEA